MDMEEMILQAQESLADDCRHCPYASPDKCLNQCMEEIEVYNPYIYYNNK